MNAAVYDFAAIAKLTKAFPEDRPQNVVEKPAEPESPAYSYSSDDLQNVDYGMFAGCVASSNATVWDSLSNECAGRRLSVDEKDQGYFAYHALVGAGRWPTVFFNGTEQKAVKTVDVDRGFIVRYAEKQQIGWRGEMQYETVYGHVKVVIPPKAT